jgi:hypothetical protein
MKINKLEIVELRLPFPKMKKLKKNSIMVEYIHTKIIIWNVRRNQFEYCLFRPKSEVDFNELGVFFYVRATLHLFRHKYSF